MEPSAEKQHKEDLKKVLSDIIDRNKVENVRFARHTGEDYSKFSTMTKIKHTNDFYITITIKSMEEDHNLMVEAVKDYHES